MVNALSFKSQQKCIPLINATNAVRLCSLHCHIFTSAPNFAETHYLTSRAVQRETVFCWLTMKYEHESTSMSPNSTIENCCRKGDWCKQRLGISTTRGSPFLAPSTSTSPEGHPSYFMFFLYLPSSDVFKLVVGHAGFSSYLDPTQGGCQCHTLHNCIVCKYRVLW